MYNYKSVRSSEPQIRSNPALRFVSDNSGFQKRLSTLLEPIPLPFPTFQIFKDTSLSIIKQHTYYAWVRPAHLRSTWAILTPDMPFIMVDPKDNRKMFSLRIAFDKRKLQHIGPIIMEGAWDAQDHVLWLWDVVFWERSNIWETTPYSKRWEILKTIVNTILDCGNPISDAEVKLPEWESLEELASRNDIDTATSVEFQPEKESKRRILYLQRTGDVKYSPVTHHERKMISEQGDKHREIHKKNNKPSELPIKTAEPIKDENSISEVPKISSEKINTQNSERHCVARLTKDSVSKLPDTYRLKSIHDEDLGLAAIRGLHISTQIRELMKVRDSIVVDIQWFEPFQKYEVKKVHQ
jgi:hypothetical protein